MPLPANSGRLVRATVRHTFKCLCWDVENRGAAYWFDGTMTSQITAIGWKWEHEKDVHTLLLRHDGYWEADDDIRVPDVHAYTRFRDVLGSADLVYGHNIRKHDLPMFNSGLLRRKLDPLPAILTTDTLKDYPRRNGMSASLENLAVLYGLKATKHHMSIMDWEEANNLHDSGIAKAKTRVVSDVLLQEQLRQKLIDLNLLKPPRRWTP